MLSSLKSHISLSDRDSKEIAFETSAHLEWQNFCATHIFNEPRARNKEKRKREHISFERDGGRNYGKILQQPDKKKLF